MANLWLIIKKLCNGAAIRRPIIILCLLLIGNTNHAQNLVSNPSFENNINCPSNFSGIFDGICNFWYSPSKNTPDYFSSCANPSSVGVPNNNISKQNAKDGIAYGGGGQYFNDDAREFLTNKLVEPLKADSLYCLTFYISVAAKNSWSMAINSIGVYFSVDSIYFDTYYLLPVTQQLQSNSNIMFSDTVNWMEVSFLYLAEGGERYMTVGNFQSNDDTDTINLLPSLPPSGQGYYFFDDFSLYECTPPPALPIKVPNIFTPNSDNINDAFAIQSLPPNSALIIYNRWGYIVYQSTNYQNNWDGDNCSDGVYYYILNTTDGKQYKGNITILRQH